MRISLFSSFRTNEPTHVEGGWDVFRGLIGGTEGKHKPVSIPDDCSVDMLKEIKKDTPAFSPAEYQEGLSRSKANVTQVWLAVLDLDESSQAGLKAAVNVLVDLGLRLCVYTSFSHRGSTDPNALVKARIVLDLDQPIPNHGWLPFWLRMVRWFQETTGAIVDDNCKDSSRIYSLPYTPYPDEASILFVEGRPLQVAGIMQLPPLEELSRALIVGSYDDIEDAEKAGTALEVHKRRERAQRYLSKMPPAKEGEGGDEQTLKAAFAGPAFGLTEDQFWPLLNQYNARCEPPWNTTELQIKMENGYRYNQRPFGYLLTRTPPDTPTPSPSTPGAASPQANVPGVEDPLALLSSNNEEDLAQHYIATHGAPQGHLKTLGKILYTYDPVTGVWGSKDDHALRGEVKKYHNARIFTDEGGYSVLKMTKTKMYGVADLVLHDLDIADLDFLVRRPPGIVFENGFARAGNDADRGVKFEEHDPLHRATWGVPYILDPSAPDPETWCRLLDDMFYHDYDKDAKINVIRQWIGATLLGVAPRYVRSLILLGPRGSGKSTITEVIDGLLPEEVRGASKPQEWSKEGNRASLEGVRLNTVQELPKSDIIAGDYFKQILSGETTMARNLYGRPFLFTPQAGHVFCGNELPNTVDNTSGFWDRVMVVGCNRSFTREGGNEGTKKDFVRRCLEDAPGIYAWALRGADDLIRKGSYDLPPSHKQATDKWRQGTDAVADFVSSCCDKQDLEGEYTGLGKIHAAFKRWASVVGRKSLSTRSLANRLRLVDGLHESTLGHSSVKFALTIKDPKTWRDYSEPSLNF